MTETADGTTIEASAAPEGSEGTPEAQPPPEVDPLALARKRQAGAEAARQEAARQLKEANARLAEYEKKDQTADQTKAADLATLQARLDAAEKRAAEAEVNATARILDAKYPNARAQLPEVTDEVRLSYFEALLAETPEGKEPPTPQNPNETNRTARADTTGTQPKEETSEDIKARLKAMKPDWL